MSLVTINVDEFIVEQDSRVDPNTKLSKWHESRKALYLLREDAFPVLSTDRRVWPGALSYNSQNSVDIAITLVMKSLRNALDIQLFRTDLGVPETSWNHLGYDISDETGLSGLSNCGYEPNAKPYLIEKWAQRLNKHHLFSLKDDALAFRDFTDERVPEHAPFYVYGLYIIC